MLDTDQINHCFSRVFTRSSYLVENLKREGTMQHDPLIEILSLAENSVQHPAKSAALRNLQQVLSADSRVEQGIAKADSQHTASG
jgi:hypothetical protein